MAYRKKINIAQIEALGTEGYVLTVTSGVPVWVVPGVTQGAAGNDTEIQYNDTGVLTASSNLTYDGFTFKNVNGAIQTEFFQITGVPSSATTSDGFLMRDATAGIIQMLSPTGTPSATTYLRGDNTWATIAGTPGGVDGDVQRNTAGAFGADVRFDFGTGGQPSLRIGVDTTMHANWSTIIGNGAKGVGATQTIVGHDALGGTATNNTIMGAFAGMTGAEGFCVAIGKSAIYQGSAPTILIGTTNVPANVSGTLNGNVILAPRGSTYANLSKINCIGANQTISNTKQIGVEDDGGVYIGADLIGGAARAAQVGNNSQNEGVSNTLIGHGSKILRGALGNVTHAAVIGRDAYFKSEFLAQALVFGSGTRDQYMNNGWVHRYYDMDGVTIVTSAPSSEPIIYHGMDAYDDVDGTVVNVDGGDLVSQAGLATGSGTSGKYIIKVGDNVAVGGNVKQAITDALTVDAVQVSIDVGGFILPVGLDAARVATQGSLRYNTTGSNFEGYDGAVWQNLQAAGGDVTKVGTPVDNQIGVWTGDGTLEGDANFRFATNQLRIDVAGGTESVRIRKDLIQFYNSSVEIVAFGALTNAGFLNIKDASSNNVATLSGLNESTLSLGVALDDAKQVIHTAHVQLSQSQIKGLSTTPIQIVAAPGASGKHLHVLNCNLKYNYNGTQYSTGGLYLRSIGLTSSLMLTDSTLLNHSAVVILPMTFPATGTSTAQILDNVGIEIWASQDNTENGGTIDVYIQYVEIDTN